jgi:hypothetical protein
MVWMLEIVPNAVADLHRLGWLIGRRRLDDAVVAAIGELVERGIALGLRPRNDTAGRRKSQARRERGHPTASITA